MSFNHPQSLGALLSEALGRLGLDARLREHQLMQVWDEVVGEQVAGAAQPEFIRDGRMFVATKSPVWANELELYKSDMISRLNARFGSPVLKDIVFKAGRIKRRPPDAPGGREEPPDSIELSEEETAKIEAVAALAGPDASDDLRALLSASLRLEKWKKASGWTPCRRCGVLQHGENGTCPPCELEAEQELPK